MKRLVLTLGLVLGCSENTEAEPIRCVGHAGGVGAVALSPDASLVVSNGDNLFARVWSADDGRMLRRLQVFSSDATFGFISAVAFSPDGKRVATAAWQQAIRFWNPATGEELGEPVAVKQAAYDLAFSPDGTRLAVGEYAKVRIWDLRSRMVLQDFQLNQRAIGQAWRVAFSPNGRLLAAALLDYGGSFVPQEPKVRVWDVDTGTEVFSAWQNESALAVAFSPDGERLAAAGRSVEIWNVKNRQSIHRIKADDTGFFCVTFSPDGKILATGGNSPDVLLWDAATGKRITALIGHTGQVRDLCFSRDGKTLASAGKDGVVLIWSMTELTPEHYGGTKRGTGPIR
jgi:WD40 repeat protein